MSSRSLVFYGLNATRLLSIISLLLVFSSSVLVMVNNIKAVNAFQAAKIQGTPATDSFNDSTFNTTDMVDCDYIMGSTVPNQPAGVFWSVVATLLIIFQCIILILSEVGWPMKFFDRYFPVLGTQFGVGSLGIFQALIGAQILSHRVDEFTLVTAFLLFSVGCLNMLLGLIFRETAKEKRSIALARNEEKGVLPTFKPNAPVFVTVNGPPTFNGQAISGPRAPEDFHSWRTGTTVTGTSLTDEKGGYGFGRQAEKAAGLKGFLLTKPEETLPRYSSPTPSATRSPVASRPVTPRPTTPRVPSPVPTELEYEESEASPVSQQPAFPFLSQDTTTPPLRVNVQRMKSSRSDTSSFVSPGARRHERGYLAPPPLPRAQAPSDDASHYSDDDEESMYAASSIVFHTRGQTPPPTFRSSPNAF